MFKRRLTQCTGDLLAGVSGLITYFVTNTLLSSLVTDAGIMQRRSRWSWIIRHYRGLRRLRVPVVYAVWLAFRRRTKERMIGDAIIALLLPVVLAVAVVIHAFGRLFRRRGDARLGKLWITSPSGRTTKQMPLYAALRIVRKQGWCFAVVEPVRKVTRWQAARILLRGDDRLREESA